MARVNPGVKARHLAAAANRARAMALEARVTVDRRSEAATHVAVAVMEILAGIGRSGRPATVILAGIVAVLVRVVAAGTVILVEIVAVLVRVVAAATVILVENVGDLARGVAEEVAAADTKAIGVKDQPMAAMASAEAGSAVCAATGVRHRQRQVQRVGVA